MARLGLSLALSLSVFSVAGQSADAADTANSACALVRFSDIGWTDVTATTALTSVVLQRLGYQTKAIVLSVPVTYAAM